jgi:hypothetical protein
LKVYGWVNVQKVFNKKIAGGEMKIAGDGDEVKRRVGRERCKEKKAAEVVKMNRKRVCK